MKILVLGGHGFIGSHIVERLCQSGHEVRSFARKPPEFKSSAEWFRGDFLDKAKLAEALVGMDAVVHCISSTVPATSATDPVFDIETNLIPTVELLRQMRSEGINRLVYLSSGGTVYGNPEQNPVCETAPLKPISSYGAVKVAIENFINVASETWGLQACIIRPSNPYGIRQGHGGVQGLISTVLNNQIKNKPTIIFGDGSSIRDYLYVTDLAALVDLVIERQKSGIFNAGSGVGVSINQVLAIIETVTGQKIDRQYKPSRGFDVNAIVLDNMKVKQAFGWQPEITLSNGIHNQYHWLKGL